MAKKSSVLRNQKRIKLAARYLELRKALKEKIRDPKTQDEERYASQLKLQDLPRNSAPIRIRNRCQFTGRARGVYRRFGLSRITFREFAHRGVLPGVRKASW
jgi:small subunit ribosomal protein S14